MGRNNPTCVLGAVGSSETREHPRESTCFGTDNTVALDEKKAQGKQSSGFPVTFKVFDIGPENPRLFWVRRSPCTSSEWVSIIII